MKNRFEVVSPFSPQGDQPQAIDKLTANLSSGANFQTLAAQLYEEFKDLFPNNAVGYFVSYYDYYQPEAYIPQRDIYIEKDASRNDDLDRLRLSATSNLVSRRDVVEVHPSYEEFAYRIEFFGDTITNINAINPLTGELLKDEDQIFIYPAVHYVMPENQVQ